MDSRRIDRTPCRAHPGRPGIPRANAGGVVCRPAGDRQGGFTLLELLVALALAAIISFCISVVSIQADKMYRAMTDKVEVYQKFRYALGDMQESLSNMIPTANLEFFVDRSDQDQRGYWEDGEQYREPENLGGGRPNFYDEGAQVIERHYTLEQPGRDSSTHANFSVYFKTHAEVDGQLHVANVEYYLALPQELAAGRDGRVGTTVQGEPGRPFLGFVLVKTVRYVEAPDLFKPSDRKVRMRVFELCQNVTDLKIEYFYDNLFGDNKPGAFVTPELERSDLVKPEVRPKVLTPEEGGGVLREFLYGSFRPPHEYVTAQPARYNTRQGDHHPVYVTAGSAQTGINFSELRQRDQIYLWSSTGSTQWAPGVYTVARNENGRVYLMEDIDTAFWRGPQPQIRFRAGYVPSAFRISIRVLNDKGGEPRLLTQVVRTLRRN